MINSAVKFFLTHLGLNENLIEKISLIETGFCDAYILNKKTHYEIGLPSEVSDYVKLYALAHEIAHLNQYETGELTDDLATGRSTWRGNLCEIETEKNYYYQPYEIDANETAKILIDVFQKKYGKISLTYSNK